MLVQPDDKKKNRTVGGFLLFSIIRLLWGVARVQKKHPQRPAIATGAPRHVFVEYMGDPNVVSVFFCSFASFFGGNCFVRYVPKKCNSARNFGMHIWKCHIWSSQIT